MILCGLKALLDSNRARVQTLACAGFVVMRNHCGLKELRWLRMFEKALDAAIRCPYAQEVEGWVVAGLGNGARIAASIGAKRKSQVAGAVLMSYPLWEPTPPAGKGAGSPDSTGPLRKLECPLLMIHARQDSSVPLASIVSFCKTLSPLNPTFVTEVAGADARLQAVPGALHSCAAPCSQVGSCPPHAARGRTIAAPYRRCRACVAAPAGVLRIARGTRPVEGV